MDDRSLAEKALRWVAYTYRPLHVRALQEALAIEPGDLDFDVEAMHQIGLILDVCAGLLIHDKENHTVRLVHYTAQDYFDKKAGSRFEKAHALIASECLTYLNYKCFQQPGAFSDDESVDGNEISSDVYSTEPEEASGCTVEDRSFYLFKYACTSWAQHALTKRDPDLSLQIHRSLERKRRVWLECSSIYDLGAYEPPLSPFGLGAHPQFGLGAHSPFGLQAHHGCEIAAFFGLNEELEVLCEGKSGTKALPCHLGSSLLFTASNAQIKATEMVLDHGADINHTDYSGRTALHIASTNGHLDIVKLLLARGINPDGRSDHGETAICKAVILFETDCMLADSTPLHCAAEHGHSNIVNILLAHGSDSERQDQFGNTPLVEALRGSHLDCVHALLDHGADVNVKNGRGFTPLHDASAKGDIRIASELLTYHAAIQHSEPTVGLKSNEQGPGSMPHVLELYLDEAIRLFLYHLHLIKIPQNLKWLLHSRGRVLEMLVWKDGLTAFDIAKLREHEEMINILQPLITSKPEPVPVSVEGYLLEQLGVASIGEAEEELDRRISAELYGEEKIKDEANEETEEEAEVSPGESD